MGIALIQGLQKESSSNIHPSGHSGLVICCPTTSNSSHLSVSGAPYKVHHPLVTNVIQMCN